MASEITYLYSVNPFRTITGLSGVRDIKTAKSLYLTKEDVAICLHNAAVYRRFADEGRNEKVTVDNLDRLHNEKFIPESEWKNEVVKDMSKDSGTVKAPVVEESKPEVVEHKVTEPVSVKEEDATTEDKEKVVDTAANDTAVAEESEVLSDDEAVENSEE